MSDRKYFQGSKRGELQELKDELHSTSKDKKKEAVKKVIAAMTVGKDVSSLFPDVINCMQTGCIELKKLVYLYIINYAKVQPELAILAVNTFFKDSMDSNPLIRALAIRTMGCIRLEQITEYLVEPLRRSCSDQDPYVRKTAVICIAKLYDISPTLMEEQGFFDLLKEMLKDQNAMVVANTVASLLEIYETSINKGHKLFFQTSDSNKSIQNSGRDLNLEEQKFFRLTFNEIEKQQILMALNECTEWGQIYILNIIAEWKVGSEKESELIIDRLTSRLSHANPAVVLSTVRAILNVMKNIESNQQLVMNFIKKMRPPVVTLLTNSPPEIQYVVLRNVQLIVQSNSQFFDSEIKMFYCKYKDPLYIKIEKLNLLYRLVSSDNFKDLLKELKEYSTDTDIEFSRNTIKIIALISIKIRESASLCTQIITELMSNSRQDHIIQEGIISLKEIIRSHPNQIPSIIPVLWEVSESIVETESRASFVWIIGEVYEFVQGSGSNNNSDNETINNFLQYFVEVFLEESNTVQLQILTTIVKCFLKVPIHNQQLVTDIFRLATTNSENPDVRDRAFIYWRLLSTNPEETRKVVLSQKTLISSKNFDIEPKLLDKLLRNIGLISSVYHKLPGSFVNIVQENDKCEILKDYSSIKNLNSESNVDSTSNLKINPNIAQNNTSELIDIEDLISYSDQPSNNVDKIVNNNNSELIDFGTSHSNPNVNQKNVNYLNSNSDIGDTIIKKESNTIDLLSL